MIPCLFSSPQLFAVCAVPLLQRGQQFNRTERNTSVSLLSIEQDVRRDFITTRTGVCVKITWFPLCLLYDVIAIRY